MRARTLGAGVLLGVAAALGPVAAQDDADKQPSAEEVREALLAELKPLVFGEDGVETLVLEGVFAPIQQRFTLHARGGDSYDLLIGAIDDAEPFLAGRDGTSLAYTPGAERGTVQLMPGLAQIGMALEERRLRFGIAMIGPQEEVVGERVIVTLDPGSILDGVTEDLAVQRGANGRYRLTGSSPSGTYVEFDVDPDAAYPVTGFRATPKDADEPAIVITSLTVNEPPGPRIMGIPSVEVLREHFEVEDLRALADDDAVAKSLGATFAATGARMRMRNSDASADPAVKAAALRDQRERRKLGQLLREAAK